MRDSRGLFKLLLFVIDIVTGVVKKLISLVRIQMKLHNTDNQSSIIVVNIPGTR